MVITEGNAPANATNGPNGAIGTTGSASSSTFTAVNINNASAPPVSVGGAAVYPPGFKSPTNAGGNTVQIIQVKF
jgi:hypothetical protein